MNDRESHLSLYRRWRPQRFADVVGQAEIVRTLRNAVVAGDVAHAYLFAGERGIGKTSVARILARAVNCLAPTDGEPCNTCANCETILANRSLDIVEIDGASNRGIDHIRRLREEVSFAPTDLVKKVYIIDEVHMLTNEAFNALLKTLEEPPPHAVFAFATTEPHKLPRTIVSRCQAFEFRKIPPNRIAERLSEIATAEGATLAPDAVDLLARRANGGLRDAVVMLEQAISYGRSEISAETVLDMLGLAGAETHEAFVDALERCDRRAGLDIVAALADRGKDLEIFLADVIDLLRDRLAQADETGSGERFARDVRLARGLLDLKTDLFRALDRRVRIEIGMLDLMEQLSGSAPSLESTTSVPADRTSDSASAVAPTARTNAVAPAETAETPTDVPDGARSIPDPSPRDTRPGAALPPEFDDPALEAAWTAMLDEIGRERIAVAAFLTESRPTMRGGTLVLCFHPTHTFHKESLEKSANLQYLAGAVHRHFGGEIHVDVAYDADVEPKPTGHELLHEKAELVRRVFDGRIVKEES